MILSLGPSGKRYWLPRLAGWCGLWSVARQIPDAAVRCRSGGVSQFPGGFIAGAGMTSAIKSKTLFVDRTLGEAGYPKGIKPFDGASLSPV
jgi:hypothetical protein